MVKEFVIMKEGSEIQVCHFTGLILAVYRDFEFIKGFDAKSEAEKLCERLNEGE